MIITVLTVFLPLTLLAQQKDTVTCLTSKEKKVINLTFQDLKFCENNSLEKDTIIQKVEARVQIKDSLLTLADREVSRLKVGRDSLQKENTKLIGKLKTTKDVIYGLVVLLVIETFIIILK